MVMIYSPPKCDLLLPLHDNDDGDDDNDDADDGEVSDFCHDKDCCQLLYKIGSSWLHSLLFMTMMIMTMTMMMLMMAMMMTMMMMVIMMMMMEKLVIFIMIEIKDCRQLL